MFSFIFAFQKNDVLRKKGLYYLEKSITIDRRNFSAFMAYLRYSQQEYSRMAFTYEPLTKKINEHMIYYEDRKELASRLHFLKAVLLVLTSTRRENKIGLAVESWMTGIERLNLTTNFWKDAEIVVRTSYGYFMIFLP